MVRWLTGGWCAHNKIHVFSLGNRHWGVLRMDRFYSWLFKEPPWVECSFHLILGVWESIDILCFIDSKAGVHIETFLIVSKTSRQKNRVSLRTFIITSGSGRPFARDMVCIPRVWNFKQKGVENFNEKAKVSQECLSVILSYLQQKMNAEIQRPLQQYRRKSVLVHYKVLRVNVNHCPQTTENVRRGIKTTTSNQTAL